MKKLLFTVLILFSVSLAFAQVRAGIKIGSNLSTFSNDVHPKMKFGYHVGGFLDFTLNENLSLQPELLYSKQGANFEAVSISLGYVNVPVLLKINIVKNFSAEIGPQVGYLLSAKQVIDKEKVTITYPGQPININTNIKEQYKDIDVTAIAGLSYMFTENIVVSARYGFGLTQLHKKNIVKSQNSVIQLSVGYKF